tara:strand:+ start:332 stop:556 length:225 start_codon:yes stop_codon:yes gene_type:complete
VAEEVEWESVVQLVFLVVAVTEDQEAVVLVVVQVQLVLKAMAIHPLQLLHKVLMVAQVELVDLEVQVAEVVQLL